MLTTKEETFIKNQYAKSVIEKQIEDLEAEKWIEVEKILAKTNDKERWEKRRLKKIEYNTQIKDLKNSIEG